MLTSELLDMLDRYLQGTISLDELEDWLVPRLPIFFGPMEHSSATDLVAGIELGLAEMSEGMRTEEEFRESVRQELQKMQIIRLDEPKAISTGSMNQSLPAIDSVFWPLPTPASVAGSQYADT